MASAAAGPADALVPARELPAFAGRPGGRAGDVLAAARVRHRLPRFGIPPGAPGHLTGRAVGGEPQRCPGDPAGAPRAVRGQHPPGGQPGRRLVAGEPVRPAAPGPAGGARADRARCRRAGGGVRGLQRRPRQFPVRRVRDGRRAGRRVRGELPGHVPRRVPAARRDAALHRLHPDRRRGQGGPPPRWCSPASSRCPAALAMSQTTSGCDASLALVPPLADGQDLVHDPV